MVLLFKRHPEYFTKVISNSYPFTEEQLAKYAKKLVWTCNDVSGIGLSANLNLPWSRGLINTYLDKWDWFYISATIIGSKIWDNELIDDYMELISWEGISNNLDIPWTDNLIEKYKNKLDWDDFTWNQSLFWSRQKLEKFKTNVNFQRLSNSTNTPWARHIEERTTIVHENPISGTAALKLIEEYEDVLDWTILDFKWDKGLSRFEADSIIDLLLES